MNDFLGGAEGIWIPPALKAGLDFVTRFSKFKEFKRNNLPSLLKKEVSPRIQEECKVIFSNRWDKQRNEAHDILKKIAGEETKQSSLYQETCESLTKYIRKTSTEKIPQQAFAWMDYLWRALKKPDESKFNKAWFLQQIESVQAIPEGSCVDRVLEHLREKMSGLLVCSLANNVKARPKEGPIQDLILDFINVLVPLTGQLSDQEKKQVHEIASNRHTIRQHERNKEKYVLELELLERKSERSEEETKRQAHLNQLIDYEMNETSRLNQELQLLYTEPQSNIFYMAKELFDFFKIKKEEFPVPPMVQKPLWELFESTFVDKVIDVYGDLHFPIYEAKQKEKDFLASFPLLKWERHV